tara:strand:+ start:77 stop:1279 length:1203 start_codon:yes stop_codon:yes gene_type:complete
MIQDFSNRLDCLGTETAFLVSKDANEFAAKGNKIYPFHLGDINITTPINIIKKSELAMKEGKTGYVPSEGIPLLRDAIANQIGIERNININRDNIVVQPGGKPVILKFIHCLMNPGDEVLYPNPGYPIYESQIEYNGGIAIPYSYKTENNSFVIDRDQFEKSINSKTRILIYNNYQNPMGSESSQEEMKWIADLAIKNNLWVLSDEAYFNIQYTGLPQSIISLPGMLERTVILYTFSKTYAMTGWRLGAAIGPKSIMKFFAKLSVNDESCTNHFIQYGGIEAIQGNQEGAKLILDTLKKRRDLLSKKLNQINGLNLFVPNSTFYLFPEITDIYNKMHSTSYEDFRKRTLQNTGVAFCTREHFGRVLKNERKKYIRFAYSGIDIDQIEEGINKLSEFWSKL